jgi:trehalose 6-phosphate synthase
MRLSLRFILPLLVVLAGFAYVVMPLIDDLTIRWFRRDLDIRATLVANTVQESLLDLARSGETSRVQRLLTRITLDERVYGAAFCPTANATPVTAGALPAAVRCDNLASLSDPQGYLLNSQHGPVLVSIRALTSQGLYGGDLVLVHDMSFVTRRSEETRQYVFYLLIGLGVVVSLLTVVIAQLSWRGWEHGMRALLRGEGLLRPSGRPESPEFSPIARDLRELIRDIASERQPRDEERFAWSPEALRAVLHDELRGQEIIVVSNREPYIHVGQGDAIEVHRPASGLVTALEPIMRACSGTWIAHGGGSADQRVVDRHDRIAVPPDEPAYSLRRIWLTEAEENGYYYGLANEGLWPLCHIAHVRPTFRTSDWDQYVSVNEKFARAVVEESKSRDPIVLVQDYHFGLLPRMIRESLPDATIITFWHIPWPNPEAFAICPWREELLDGMLGSSILGFHTQFHCNNFVDTVARQLEARVDREAFTVSYRGVLTAVKRYPISIEWPPPGRLIGKPVEECRADVRRRHNLPADQILAVGVDRFDYTKGIEERLRAVERLLERRPELSGRFTFIQIAAPTRVSIPEYEHYQTRVRGLVDRVNARFPDEGRPPVLLLPVHHEPAAVYEYYRAADICVVTSLHDGMNLVAKEFVTARDDERGVLVLSQFTGAARELSEAIIVNPYDADESAAALEAALDMPVREQQARMRLMRSLIGEFNVYRWAGRMLIDAAAMRNRRRSTGYGRGAGINCRAGRAMTGPPRGFAYFLDIDGTLVEFADHPSRVTLNRAVLQLVDTLHRSSGGALALITGRSINDVDRLFPGSRLPAAGLHGLERRAADGSLRRHAERTHALDLARRRLDTVIRSHPALVIEDKGLSLALHCRRAPQLAGLAERVMRSLQKSLGDRYCLQHGKRVVELAPAGRDKGAAIAAFMREDPFRGRTPFFIGDDVTDEYGFATVNRMGGCAVKVGRGRTVAGWRFPDVRAVRSWLEHGRPAPRRVTPSWRPAS